MSENEWWRDAAKLDAAYHGKNAAGAGPVISKTVVLKAFTTEEEREEFKEDSIAMSPMFSSGHVQLTFFPLSGQVFSHDGGPPDSDYSIVTSVNGVPYTSFEQGISLLLEEGPEKRLQMVLSVFAEIFFNPALSIDLGLLDLLRFQIEELKLDVNIQECAGILFREDPEREGWSRSLFAMEGRSLLFHALAQPDQRLFDYLLSLQGIEANPVLEHSIKGQDIRDFGTTLLHEIPSFAGYSLLDEEIDLISRLRRILEREDVDVNCRDEYENITPLEELCEFWPDVVLRPRLVYDVARLYLSMGARNLELAKESLDEFLEEEDDYEIHDAECTEYCRKLIDLLAEAEER